MIGVSALFIAVVALISGFFGYRLIRNYVRDEFDDRVVSVYGEKGEPIVAARLNEVIAAYDDQFAELVRKANEGLRR